ncbi:hypothetical protein GXM_09538 [Nostoc sphaeroides CCNUC1]|uniref:Uncharacterized protein n=1 Tax=Nostoc sphaeroides CCNUC1 TaxID=2653204 RepID=A0A5P8WH00_9NOSO|nr:hypothetical protein GXM_09384 [Nostoc sphaeroides CCNUC1]QFS52044.1 hypothetical protein GXM_09538 [Nostoc sphaeroides CCNUC1]
MYARTVVAETVGHTELEKQKQVINNNTDVENVRRNLLVSILDQEAASTFSLI